MKQLSSFESPMNVSVHPILQYISKNPQQMTTPVSIPHERHITKTMIVVSPSTSQRVSQLQQ